MKKVMIYALCVTALFGLVACKKPEPQVEVLPTVTPVPTETPTPAPTATPEPSPTPAPHVHEYAEKIKREPTCDKEGTKVFTCECGDKYEEKIPALGYTYTDMDLELYARKKVKVQKEPNEFSEYFDFVILGERVKVTGKCNEVDWYRVDFRGATGYIKATHLVDENPVPTAPPIEEGNTLFDVPVYGKITNSDIWKDDTFTKAEKAMNEGTVDKINYEFTTGETFCIWNLRLIDERDIENGAMCWWFIAPQGDEFTSGSKFVSWAEYISDSQKKYYDEEEVIKKLEYTAIQQSEKFNAEFAEARVGFVSDKPKYPLYVNGDVFPYELFKVFYEDGEIYVWLTSAWHSAWGDCMTENCKSCAATDAAKKEAEKKFGSYVIYNYNEPTIWTKDMVCYYKYRILPQ